MRKSKMEHAITVAELIKELQQCDPDKIVVIQKDNGGDDWSLLESVDRDGTYYDDEYDEGESDRDAIFLIPEW